MKNPLVSIIIPFYNAEETLEELLISLLSQSYNDFEVILINNNSTDLGKSIIFDVVGDDSRFTVLDYSEKPSSYASRNHGYEHSNGDFLLFTDADCCPDLNWVESVVSSIKINPRTVISGRVELDILSDNNIWEAFDKVAHMKNEEKASSSHVATANMAVTRQVFNNVGMFKDVVSGGDYEWSSRALQRGYPVKYDCNIIVHHPTRKSKTEIKKKLFRISYGQFELSKEENKYFSTFLYTIRTANPLRVLIYSNKVRKITGFKRSLLFFVEYYLLCLQQSYVFFKGGKR
ncbi:glycosyltransferase [Vibrio splendidus]|uniref:glycosyltransferase n=1 Tax=Vibrio splendidus TaxID=29497 RepID=UPI000D385A06|nr:glycosyltransferase family A protein [Vibrio splendidus]PTP92710.1 hypothetical protein CWO02_12445 [Vibrio splendidus]